MSLGHFFSFCRSSVWNAWHYTEETLVHVFTAERKIQVGLIINEPVESESEHELSPLQFDGKLQLLILCAEAFFCEHKPYLHDEMNFFYLLLQSNSKKTQG